MKKNIYKYIIGFLFILLLNNNIFQNVYSVRVLLPKSDRQEDVNIPSTQIDNNISNEGTLIQYIKIINSYLWFSIAGIAMAILIYAGILLITSGGDKSKVGKAGKMALYSIIGVVVAMLSYTIVNLIINLI